MSFIFVLFTNGEPGYFNPYRDSQDYETEEEARSQQRAVESLMNEMH
jgi:hypothetical protein